MIDSLALVLLMIPGFYFLLFRPMVASIETERVLNAALQEREEQFRGIYEQSPIAIEIYDFDGLLVKVNQACLDLFGIDDIAEVEGFNLFEDPNISEDAKKQIQKGVAVQYESVFDFDLVKKLGLYRTSKSGKYFIDVRITPLRAENGNKNGGYLVQVQDITERRRAEEALRESETKWRSLVEYSPERITILDRDGIILFINRTTPGRTVKEATGTCTYDYLPPNEKKKLSQVLESVFQLGEPKKYVSQIIKADGTEGWYENNAVPVKRDRRIVEAIFISTDITERKRAEEALQASRTELKTRNRIANVFLMKPDETLYADLLDVILDVMASEFGFVSYYS